ncbi:TlyA family RNA methyltransferase [Acetobacterium carbinolicum]|uniref:TlyA family RNA methyltransferase n=1 Tax=Acetobacterium TaxID=33951 RepID=UPI0029E7088B|nr:TlyA family RNA methyltransferase [Acetobacterium sp. K1/6]MDK2940510.1 rRNA (cytidine1920-2-O)/16S rRNA (cytidine1409-2-O)-methyltransferase [Acetobacterium sp.]MDZ5724963.1 TlyA family RNA methyltransferase [Acetobacterium sp. K1/6]
MKERLDKLLVSLNYFDTRERAKKAIMAGLVQVNDQVKDKAGDLVDTEATIKVKGSDMPYVSRGGLKLEKGLAVFDMTVAEKTFIDIGSSTGGFTDCLLQNGAKKVYAVDVGYGQLDWKLRNDPRVVSMERTNFRYLTAENISEIVDGTVMDVSFISITKLIPAIKLFMKPGARGIWLIKPQFEAGRERIGKNGVIRDKKVHESILFEVITAIENQGFLIKGLDFSPIQGPKGNIEFLVLVENTEPEIEENWSAQIHSVVTIAHESCKKKKEPQNE